MLNSKYMYIGIEVSTQCNAKCPWCFATKLADGVKSDRTEGFMSFDVFKSVIERLEALGFIHKDVVINLYAIGEPFLNMDIKKIFSYLNDKSLKYAVSTNASIVTLFEEGTDILKNLTNLIISIPGFSQESYDRVHGFRFSKIKKNIVRLIENFRKCGFNGDDRLVYHVYQFNIDEIYKAREFADQNNIDFYPYYAILYEYRYVKDFISNTLSYDLLKKASGELFLGNIEKTISTRASDYICDFFNMLLIDVNTNLKTCCQIRQGDPGYSYGNIFDLSADDIRAKRTTQPICRECQAMGMDYYLSVYTPFNLYTGSTGRSGENHAYGDLLKLIRESTGKEIVLFGAGEFGVKALTCLGNENIRPRFFADNNPLKIGKNIHDVRVIAPADILKKCRDPLVVITTVNHRQVMNQLYQLGIRAVYYFPIDVYPC
jgi:MoaA/NifB/PqqE/SkfB family radical SAM enzyme